MGPSEAADAGLVVARHDIRFEPSRAGFLRVAVRVHNRTGQASRPTTLALLSSPFGAFFRSTPLTTLPVPALPADGATWLGVEAQRPVPASRAELELVQEALRMSGGDADVARNLVEDVRRWDEPDLRPGPGELAPDVLRFLGAGGAHWAGGIHVEIDGRAFARHRSGPLRILPGRTNRTYFCLGEGEFSFEVHGAHADWPVHFREVDQGPSVEWIFFGRRGKATPPDFREILPLRFAQVDLDVPRSVTLADLEVRVRRAQDDAVAAVELQLDASAEGPGCQLP